MEKLYEHTVQKQIDDLKAQVHALTIGAATASVQAAAGLSTVPATATTLNNTLGAGATFIGRDQVNNNVTINIFGAEDTSYMRRPEVKAILDRALRVSPTDPQQAVRHALTQIGYSVYSNTEHPENITCYIPNKKREEVLVHTGERWELRPSSEVTPDMYVNSMNILFNQQPFEDVAKYGQLMTEARDREHDPHFASSLHRGYTTLLTENKGKLRLLASEILGYEALPAPE